MAWTRKYVQRIISFECGKVVRSTRQYVQYKRIGGIDMSSRPPNKYAVNFVGQRSREIGKIQAFENWFKKSEKDILSETMLLIRAFCEERNFTIYYVRRWNRDGKTVFDVGSHTEFFLLTPGIEINREKK